MSQYAFSSLLVAVALSPGFVLAGGTSKNARSENARSAKGAESAAAAAAAVNASGRPLNPADYPYAYRPIGYLGTVGPAPMRFSAASPVGNERTPPRVSASNKKPELSETAEGMSRTEAIEAYRSVFGRKVPVPEGSVAGGEVDPNFVGPERIRTSVSADEPRLMDFFPPPAEQDPKAQDRRLRFMMDPLFQSAPPPQPGAVPVYPGYYVPGVVPPVLQRSNLDESRRASRATFNQVP
jgi:hypothetical protein